MSALPCRVSVLALRLRGLLAAPVRINIRRRDYSPRGLRCPCQSINARVAYFPPFWRPFGLSVVSSAGAVSLRPFRWCRCAYKVAAPVWPCFRPCLLQMVSRASLAAVSCPIICTPSDISPTSHNGIKSRHTGAPCAYKPCGLAGGVWWLSRRVSYWRRYYRGGGVSTYASIHRGHAVAGNCTPPCLPCQSFKKRVPLAGGLCTAPAVLAVSLRGVICARAGYRAPPWVTLHGLTLCGIIPRANRR